MRPEVFEEIADKLDHTAPHQQRLDGFPFQGILRKKNVSR